MTRKVWGALLVAALGLATLGQSADASLLSLPKSLKNSLPLDDLEMNLPIWGPSAKSFFCIQNLSACQDQPKEAHPDMPSPREAKPNEVQPKQPRPKQVALFSLPKSLKPQLDRVPQDTPTLAPMAHTMFCLQYPRDCEIRRVAFRGTKLDLTEARMTELVAVNLKVNRTIRPEPNMLGLTGEKWLIAPSSGDCNDYAVTKRHDLLERGWPSRTLLLAEVVVPSGEHHLVLVVRTKQGDFVLDNLVSAIRPWARTPYQWVRIQSGANPKYWSWVKRPAARSV